MGETELGGLLVLGASGFLGSHVLRAARGASALPVYAVSRKPPGGVGTNPEVSGLTWFSADINDPVAMGRLFESLRPRACILTAALSRMGACEADPIGAQDTNSLAPEHIAHCAREARTRLVHVSSDLVFGGEPGRAAGYREGDATAALSVYGRTKAEGEERVLAANPSALVCRLPLLYGDSGASGEWGKWGVAQGASDQILAARARGERSVLFEDEIRTPLDVAQAATALVELAGEEGLAAKVSGLLHVAGPLALDRYRFAELVLAAQGLSQEAIEAGLERSTRAALGLEGQRPANVALDSSRARSLLRTILDPPELALRRQ
ncbi:MAG: dTDP-4-dehydrorhamnose reductase [Planctomycetota bacterium]|jgi:dTDP-4-dehydrorhamnose reductase